MVSRVKVLIQNLEGKYLSVADYSKFNGFRGVNCEGHYTEEILTKPNLGKNNSLIRTLVQGDGGAGTAESGCLEVDS